MGDVDEDYDYAGDADLILSLQTVNPPSGSPAWVDTLEKDLSTAVTGGAIKTSFGPTSVGDNERKGRGWETFDKVLDPASGTRPGNSLRRQMSRNRNDRERLPKRKRGDERLSRPPNCVSRPAERVHRTPAAAAVATLVDDSDMIAGNIRLKEWQFPRREFQSMTGERTEKACPNVCTYHETVIRDGTIVVGVDKFEYEVSRKGKDGRKVILTLIGCVVNVQPPEESKSGKCDGRRTTASLLAFDQATGECLKLKRGMVVAVLNPSSIKSKMPHQRHGIALVAARKKQVVILGLAEYFGFCSAVDSRSAKECGSWIDKRFGIRCSFHSQEFFTRATTSSRPVLNSFSAPKSRVHSSKSSSDRNITGANFRTRTRGVEIDFGKRPDASDQPISAERVRVPIDPTVILEKSRTHNYGHGARFFERAEMRVQRGDSKHASGAARSDHARKVETNQPAEVLLYDSSDE